MLKILERPAVVAALLALAACLLLSRCWDAPFYEADDREQVRSGVESSIYKMFAAPHISCFPVTALSFRIDYWLFCTEKDKSPAAAFNSSSSVSWAAGSRLLNAFYHFLAALVLWQFILRASASSTMAAFVSIAWAVHPVACEVVCWVAERKTVLAALFGFSSLLAWTSKSRLWRWPLVGILFLLAAYSKSSALGLLPVFLLLEVMLAPQSPGEKGYWLKLAAHLATPVFVFILGLSLARSIYPYDIVDPPGGNMFTAILTDVPIGAHYVLNALIPVNLSFYYAVVPVVSLGDARLWGCLLALGVFFGIMLYIALPNRRRLAAFGILWFIAAAAPNCNLVATAFPMQDRFIYLSIPGLLLAAALAFEGLVERLKISEQLRLAPGIIFVLALSVLSLNRSGLFASEKLLAFDAAQKNPASGFAQLRAGQFYKMLAIDSLPSGRNPNAEMAPRFADLADRHLEAASNCNDIGYFSDRFEIRTWRCEMLVFLGKYTASRELMTGWLPPPDMKMLPDNATEAQQSGLFKRSAFYSCYRRETLTFAWALLGEASLRQSAEPGTAPEQRVARCRQGLADADHALAVQSNQTVLMLKARLLLQLASIETADEKLESARAHFDEANAILKSVPETSNLFATAKMLLQNVTRP